MTPVPTVTIAVVTWNSREMLARCLHSLRGDAERGLAHVWVVDNASTDGSSTMVRTDFPWASLEVSHENLGFGAAVNRVAEVSDTDWLIAANADIEINSSTLHGLLTVGCRHPEAGAFAPRLELLSGSTQQSVFQFPRLQDQIAATIGGHRLGARLARRLDGQGESLDESGGEVDYAMGAFLMIRRSAFDAIGGFDVRQWMYAEDMDLSWRLRRAGWTTRYVPEVTVRHVGGASTDVAFPGEAATRTLAAHYAWIDRRFGRLRMLAFAGLILAGAAARLTFLWPMSRLAPSRFASAYNRVDDWWRVNRTALRTRRLAERR